MGRCRNQSGPHYSTPIEHHNPMEPHASTVLYQSDGTLHIHDKTQGPQNCQAYVQKVFGLDKRQVRIFAAFVGGAFGSGLRPQYQLPLAVMAAMALKRSVRVTLTRQQMFTFGYRPRTLQRLQMGAPPMVACWRWGIPRLARRRALRISASTWWSGAACSITATTCN